MGKYDEYIIDAENVSISKHSVKFISHTMERADKYEPF